MKKILRIQTLLLLLAFSVAPAATCAAQDTLPPGGRTLAKVISITAVANGAYSVTVQEWPLQMGATYLFPNGKATIFLIDRDPAMVKECLKAKNTGAQLLLEVVKINNTMGLSVSGKRPAEIYKAIVATTEFN